MPVIVFFQILLIQFKTAVLLKSHQMYGEHV